MYSVPSSKARCVDVIQVPVQGSGAEVESIQLPRPLPDGGTICFVSWYCIRSA